MKIKQTWKPGHFVNAGFMRGLLVVAICGRERLLMDRAKRFYSAIPYEGCAGISEGEAMRLYVDANDRISLVHGYFPEAIQ